MRGLLPLVEARRAPVGRRRSESVAERVRCDITLMGPSSLLPPPAVPAPTSQIQGEAARALRILVADDEPMILKALKRILEWRGHFVTTASSAHEALERLAESSYDAAMVDARMPGDGITVLKHLEADPGFTGTVVLMTGALSSDPSLEVGPTVLRLQKPFRFLDIVPLLEGEIQH
jgi:CheY-like chemotaxis protein